MIRLDVKSLALASGITWGAALFLVGLLNMVVDYGGFFVDLMSSIYIGYDATLLGSLIGGVWGFVDGGIAGLLIAWLYNHFSNR